MSEVHNVVITPETGDIIDLPEDVGRTDIERVGSPELGHGTLKVGIVGQGNLIPHVVVKSDADITDVTEGSQILGTDVATGGLLYAIPHSAYNGGPE